MARGSSSHCDGANQPTCVWCSLHVVQRISPLLRLCCLVLRAPASCCRTTYQHSQGCQAVRSRRTQRCPRSSPLSALPQQQRHWQLVRTCRRQCQGPTAVSRGMRVAAVPPPQLNITACQRPIRQPSLEHYLLHARLQASSMGLGSGRGPTIHTFSIPFPPPLHPGTPFRHLLANLNMYVSNAQWTDPTVRLCRYLPLLWIRAVLWFPTAQCAHGNHPLRAHPPTQPTPPYH